MPTPTLTHPHMRRPRPSGHQVVVFHQDASNTADLIHDAGRRHSRDFILSHAAADDHDLVTADDHAIHFDELNVAIIRADDIGADGAHSIAHGLAEHPQVADILPDCHVFTAGDLAIPITETPHETWGLRAVQAEPCPFTGKGITVAVLDTGIDESHPAFSGRIKDKKSFVKGETVADGNGHGTHCAGTIAGAAFDDHCPRFGIAPDATLLIGKVMDNAGNGHLRSILGGMRWALGMGADILSMSVAGPMPHHKAYYEPYQRIAQKALDQGRVIIAAAGNQSHRMQHQVSPVEMPASSPSVLSVGALGNRLDVAPFSNGPVDGRGKAIDVAAPGIFVLSAFPAPRMINVLSGTSMACPHVAGIAALHAESDAKLRGKALWDALIATAHRLDGEHDSTGAGLVQAPGALSWP